MRCDGNLEELEGLSGGSTTTPSKHRERPGQLLGHSTEGKALGSIHTVREKMTMAAKYSDVDIARLLAERKPLPKDFRTQIRLRDKRGHKEQELDIEGVDGNLFRLVLRQSSFNALDFSIILAHCQAATNQVFRLRRYNGKSHEHTNTIESHSFYAFHVHTATERYQELGSREDAYAEPSDRFSDFHTAVRCMLADCVLELPYDPQQSLFEEIRI